MTSRARPILLLLSVTLASGQPSFREEKLHGREAYVLENGVIRVSALRGGGHIAEVRFLSSHPRKALNPMRVPHYATIEPHRYDPAKHDRLYGDGSHRWLSSGYMGHLLCFPAFGPPSSDEEVRNGLGNHGEAPIVEWKQTRPLDLAKDRVTLSYGADLPKTQYRVERTITLREAEPVVYVEEWVENLTPYDRPINWVQHATFGAPFAVPGKNVLDVSATRGKVADGRPRAAVAQGSEFTWPTAKSPDGKVVDLRAFQPDEKSGLYYALLLDPGRAQSYFTMYNTEYPVLIGYLFPTADNPWIGDWQENQSNSTPPWNGKVVARGMEFGTTPMPEGLRKSVERGRLFGVPTFRWIGGRQRLQTSFRIFLAEIPAGFKGVADVTSDGIVERDTGRKIFIRMR